MFTGLIADLGEVLSCARDDAGALIRVRTRLALELHEGDSIALNGVSLTVSGLEERTFQIALIPETLTRTNLGSLQEGSLVNIEVDVMAKHVERLLGARA